MRLGSETINQIKVMNTTTRMKLFLWAGLVAGWALPAHAQREGDEPEGAAALLAVLDRDGDGELSRGEIDMAIVVLRRLDENGDGKVATDEMVAPPVRRGGPPAQARGSGDRRGGGLPPWDQLDSDGDGKISKEEAPGPMKERFDRLDQDKDGFIDKKEQESVNEMFRRQRGGGQGRPPGEGGPGAGMSRGGAFNVLAEKYDKDGDGTITSEEYTRDEQRFAAIDRNRDGKLTAADYEGRRGGGGGMARPAEDSLPKAGDRAPDFKLAYAKKKSKLVKLSSFAGKRPVALVFGSYT